MALSKYTKGWFVKELKAMGIGKHPKTKKSLKSYNTTILRQLHDEAVTRKEAK